MMWQTLLQLSLLLVLVSQGTPVSAQGGDWIPPPPPPCMPGDAWQEGCILKSCNVYGMQESLAPECVKLIEEKVEEIVVKKLAERGIECSSQEESTVTEPTRYETPGIILAGGSWQNEVKLFKPDTKEVCKLPKLPSYFSWASMDLVDGTPVLCGSFYGSPGKSRMKNETEKREFFPTSSCVQLSPASKEAEWTIYRDDLPIIRTFHVSMVTPEGLLLMGGNGRKSVDLVKPDGSVQSGVFDLERTIDRGCGIEVEGTLIITGGMYNYIESARVERYNSQGHVDDLPDLNEARVDHGCGYFHREGKKVLVVAGGYFGSYTKLSSTETHTLGSDAWSLGSPLPRAIKSFASVSLNDKIYFIVGDGKRRRAKALVFEFDGEKWEEIEKINYFGLDDRYQGNRAVAVDLAKSGFDEFCI